MSILEQVARALYQSHCEEMGDPPIWGRGGYGCESGIREIEAAAAITAFLEAAAQPDNDGRTWRMVPDEATEEMYKQCAPPQEHLAWPANQHERHDILYRAMLQSAPKFKMDGETT